MSTLIAIVADQNYAAPAVTLIRSIVANWALTELPALRILGPAWNLPQQQHLMGLARLLGLRELTFAGTWPEQLPVRGHWNSTVYARLSLAESCGDVPRVVCLDSDVVALTSLHPLFSMCMDDFAVAAVRDPCVEGSRGSARGEYLNSGLLVVDLAAWVRLRLGERSRELLVRSPEPLEYLDQDALNLTLGNEWKRLDPRWNVFHYDEMPPAERESALRLLSREQLSTLQQSAWCLHYVGPNKPWREGYPAGRNWRRYDQFAAGRTAG